MVERKISEVKEEISKESSEEEKAKWATLKPAEVEKLVIDLGKQGESPAKIGIILRDKHGVPKVKSNGKKISQILKEAKISFSGEQERVKKKVSSLESHIGKNKHDYSAKKSLAKTIWLAKK